MGKTRLFAVAVCAAAVMGMGAGGALAGEVKGHGNGNTPIGAAPDADPHAGSICSFSGQNDDPNEEGAGGRVQHPAPGDLHGGDNACRGFASAGHGPQG